MEKLTVGRRNIRDKHESEEKIDSSTPRSDFLTAIGLCTMCFMLVLSMLPTDARKELPEAVAVMSTAVESSEREELVVPDKKASVVGDESFFETIGEFFASLIMGED